MPKKFISVHGNKNSQEEAVANYIENQFKDKPVPQPQGEDLNLGNQNADATLIKKYFC